MKRLLSLLVLLVAIVTGAKADPNATSIVLFDAADEAWANADLINETTTNGAATWYGGSGATIDNGKTIYGVEWGKRLKFGGSSKFSTKKISRVLGVIVPKSGLLKVFFRSGSNKNERSINISTAPTSTESDESTIIGTCSDIGAGSVATAKVEAGTYYVWSTLNMAVLGVTLDNENAYFVGTNNVEYLLTESNYNADDFFNQGEKNRWTPNKGEGKYLNGEKYYNMANTSQYLTLNVKGARDFKFVVENGTAGRHYSVQINDEEPVIVEHTGWGNDNSVLKESQVFATPSTSEIVTIKISGYDGGANSVYPMSIIFNSSTKPIIDKAPVNAEYMIGSENYPSFSVKATSVTMDDLSYEWYSYNGSSMTTYECHEATFSQNTMQTMYFNAFKSLVLNKAGEYEIGCRVSDKNGTTITKATLTVVAPSTECRLTSVKFQNNVFGAITEPTATANGTVEVPYVESDGKPGIYYWSPVISESATVDYDENAITVTAEDGVTKAVYDINYVAVTPLSLTADIEETEFTEVPSWVYNHYGYDEANGVKFAKAENSDATETEEEDYRISKGNTRQYYFIGEAKSFTLISKGTSRMVNVEVNGIGVMSDVSNDAIGTIDLDETLPYSIIMIESAQTSGDGGFGSYSAEAGPQPFSITLNKYGLATFSYKEDVQVMPTNPENEGVQVYAAADISGKKVYMEAVYDNVIPTGQGVLIKGEPNATVWLKRYYDVTDFPVNYLWPTTVYWSDDPVPVPTTATPTTQPGDAESDALTLDGKTFKWFQGATFNANKAYLLRSDVLNAIEEEAQGNNTLEMVFEGEATVINKVNANENADSVAPAKVIKEGKLFIGNYNVAGQRVK